MDPNHIQILYCNIRISFRLLCLPHVLVSLSSKFYVRREWKIRMYACSKQTEQSGKCSADDVTEIYYDNLVWAPERTTPLEGSWCKFKDNIKPILKEQSEVFAVLSWLGLHPRCGLLSHSGKYCGSVKVEHLLTGWASIGHWRMNIPWTF
jgi:hypothetical protein